ncbi:hypothetical protein D3C78_1641130 [compost metagenome]
MTLINCGNWAMKIRMASAFTNPVTTDRDTYCISRSSRRNPAMTWKTPIRMVAANRYSTPCCLTRGPTSTATAAVAAEIMPGRPPTKEMITAMENDA